MCEFLVLVAGNKRPHIGSMLRQLPIFKFRKYVLVLKAPSWEWERYIEP